MYVFRKAGRVTGVANLFGELSGALLLPQSRENQLCILMAAAALECALADLSPVDGADSGQDAATRHDSRSLALEISFQAARQYVCGASPVWQPTLARLAALIGNHIVEASDPEGFRFYGLVPDAYLPAVHKFLTKRYPNRVCVIGLRTIGSTLAPVVAAELERHGVATLLVTLRPRGSPTDRAYRLSSPLQRELGSWPGEFVIVDEGPGLSGSSFNAAARLLSSYGIDNQRITMLPSWDAPAESFSNSAAARDWPRWRKIPAATLQSPIPDGKDIGAGRWRDEPGVMATPVWPQQERPKYLSAGSRVLYKFCGIGRFGRDAWERARLLANKRFSPDATYAGDGWLQYKWLTPHTLHLRAFATQAWAEHAAQYLAFLRSTFALGTRDTPAPELRLMMKRNVELILNRECALEPPAGIPVALDGRMLPHEWAISGGRFIKFDSVDHCNDHFFPGPADIAWDISSVEVEFSPSIGDAVARDYIRQTGDNELPRRLPWYRLAYCSFRAAFAAFAQQRTDEPDRGWFLRDYRRYRTMLQQFATTAETTQKPASTAAPHEAARRHRESDARPPKRRPAAGDPGGPQNACKRSQPRSANRGPGVGPREPSQVKAAAPLNLQL